MTKPAARYLILKLLALVFLLGANVGVLAYINGESLAPKLPASLRQSLTKPDDISTPILFVGNSYTFYNDMPAMVWQLSLSAKLEHPVWPISSTIAGGDFHRHWQKGEVAGLLKHLHFSKVVLQGRSGEALNAPERDAFAKYGKLLVDKVNDAGAQPLLFVTWEYAPNNEFMQREPAFVGEMYKLVQQTYADLAARTGAQLVNIGALWKLVQQQKLPFAMFEPDGSHPSLQGSYLIACGMLEQLAPGSLQNATWRPANMTETDAVYIRKFVMQHPRELSTADADQAMGN